MSCSVGKVFNINCKLFCKSFFFFLDIIIVKAFLRIYICIYGGRYYDLHQTINIIIHKTIRNVILRAQEI